MQLGAVNEFVISIDATQPEHDKENNLTRIKKKDIQSQKKARKKIIQDWKRHRSELAITLTSRGAGIFLFSQQFCFSNRLDFFFLPLSFYWGMKILFSFFFARGKGFQARAKRVGKDLSILILSFASHREQD